MMMITFASAFRKSSQDFRELAVAGFVEVAQPSEICRI